MHQPKQTRWQFYCAPTSLSRRPEDQIRTSKPSNEESKKVPVRRPVIEVQTIPTPSPVDANRCTNAQRLQRTGCSNRCSSFRESGKEDLPQTTGQPARSAATTLKPMPQQVALATPDPTPTARLQQKHSYASSLVRPQKCRQRRRRIDRMLAGNLHQHLRIIL